MAEARPVLLVGSVPLESSTAVFDAVGDALGGLVKRVPDGETGSRKDWIVWQGEVFARTPGLQPGGTRPLQGGYLFQLYRVPENGADAVRFGALGYAASALASYEEFKAARTAGRIAPGTRFQVSLPTPLAVVLSFSDPGSIAAIWPKYEQRLSQEVAEIVAGIPHEDLAIQWDVAAEIVFILEDPAMAAQFPMPGLVAAIARISAPIPAGVELGLHLCYGDPGHKHVVEPRDTGLLVRFANELTAAIQRPVAWVHMPVPRDRDDAAYFAPLRDLRLPPGTELYLGLVHLTDGAEGAQRRLAAAKTVVTDFGIATECGFGRRPPETVPNLLALHRDISGLG
ncbi:MAG: hypothetical protein M3024_02425 [Candidatus Dormibacteraeota bacterium]|nr:hypothetical protein [Candidatus Dormibacteraeota bacterium]